MNPNLSARSSLAEIQLANDVIYSRANGRYFSSPRDFLARSNRQIVRVATYKQCAAVDSRPYRLAMAFSWLMALANRLDIQVESVACRDAGFGRDPAFADIQAKLARLCVSTQGMSPVTALIEVCVDSDALLENFQTTHCGGVFETFGIAVGEFVRRFCLVAEDLNISLAVEMQVQFADGCPKCHHAPCDCPFSVPTLI